MDSVSNCGLGMDLQKLISCIHWHEDSGDTQVILESLNTIIDICNNEVCGRDAFREEGGLDYLLEFMFTTSNTTFLEHSLKTLACVIDENAHNQTYMTKKAVFDVIQTILKNTTFPVVIRKNAVIFISAVLYQNSTAQSLIYEVGLLQDLLQAYELGAQRLLAGSSYSTTSDDPLNELWISSNSALCFAVNNPQNEKNQDVCSRIFSISLRVLEVTTNPDIISSVSAFLSLCISNNKYCQDKFAELDGLQVIKRFFQKYYDLILADVKECNNVLRRGTLQVVGNIIGIISAVALEHEQNSAIFGKLGVLSLMVKLLFLKILDNNLKTKIILSLGHTIDACSSNKSYVLNTENFDNLLKDYLHIGNQELSSACKYLLQICLLLEETSANKENIGVRVDCFVERCDKGTKSGFVNNSSQLKKVCKTPEERCSIKRPGSCISIKSESSQKCPLKCNNNMESFNTPLAKKARTDIFEKREIKPTEFDFHGWFDTTRKSPTENTSHSKNFIAAQEDINIFHSSDSSSDSSDSPYYSCETLLELLKSDNPLEKDQNESLPFPPDKILHSKDASQNTSPKQKIQDEKLLDSYSKDENNHALPSRHRHKRPILKDNTNLDGQPSEKMFKFDPMTFRKRSSSVSSSSMQSPNFWSACTSPEVQATAFDRSNYDGESCCSSQVSTKPLSSSRKRNASAVEDGKRKKRRESCSSTSPKTRESPCDVNESYSNNCVQVIVFPAEKCDEHNLISSFETLQVVPLEEAQLEHS